VVELIRDRFDLYYVGLFLADEAGEWAVLEAGTGEAGKAMLARRHQIRVGEGMVGWSVARGNWRVAAEAEADAVRLATPELPLTRSEAALPLRSRGRTLGALTVQHTEPGAFDPDTMAVLQTMADQVAVALDNAALFAESQESLSVLRRAYGEVSRQSWAELVRARPDWGYRYAHGQVSPVEGEPWPEMVQAASPGAGPGTLPGVADRATSRGGNGEDVPPSWEDVPPSGEDAPPSGEDASGAEVEAPPGEVGAPRDGDRSLAIPIRVRDQQIGVLGFRKRAEEGAWTREETELLETLTDQLEVALESARLYQDTQRRAAEEQLLGEVTARMRETLDVDTVLQTAIQEMGAALGLSRVEVRMGETRALGEGGEHVAAD
jgi:GAF domain-containing protein